MEDIPQEVRYTAPITKEDIDTLREDIDQFPGMSALSHEAFADTIFGVVKGGAAKKLILSDWVLDRWITVKNENLNQFLRLIVQPASEVGIQRFLLEEAITYRLQTRNGAFPVPCTATELLQQHFDPLHCFVEEILAEGLTILAGKPKKGKSYLALDMSLAITAGRPAFNKFWTEKVNVLYVSLEDGPRRLQRRLLQIKPDLITPKGLDFLHGFPRLGDGAFEAIAHYAQTYQVIIIDVIGRILPPQTPARKSLSEYQEFTDLLGPIQQLGQDKHISIVVIDHLRKASVEDEGDAIMGSQAKVGVADHALIYSRKGEEKDGVLQIISRDLDEQKLVLSMVNGHLEFLGKGEVYETDSEQNRIIRLLEEEARPMAIPEIMKAMGISGDAHYKRFRVVMHRLYDTDRVGRTKRGLYRLYSSDDKDDDSRSITV